MYEIMLDLETMGISSNAAITAIGAVAFDLETGEVSDDRFYLVIDLEDSVRNGGVMGVSTVLWWMRQSDEARAMYLKPGRQLAYALADFKGWAELLVPDRKSRKVWGNGAAFDNVILRNAYERLDLTPPWDHWNDRCYRTVKAMFPEVKLERVGTAHNAVDDAESQARHLIKMIGGK